MIWIERIGTAVLYAELVAGVVLTFFLQLWPGIVCFGALIPTILVIAWLQDLADARSLVNKAIEEDRP